MQSNQGNSLGGYSPNGGQLSPVGSQTVAASKQSEMQEELLRLDQFLSALIAQTETLEIKLESVLRPPTPEKGTNPTESRSTPLGQALQELNRKARIALDNIGNMRDRLEI